MGETPYREYPAPHDLRRFVECFWTIRTRVPEEERTTQLVLPDGCMDVIFDLGAPTKPRATAVGTMTRPLPVEVVGSVHLFGARFRPAAATAFLPLPARVLTDRVVPLDDLDGWRSEELAERLGEARCDSERVASLSEALRTRLDEGAGRIDPVVFRASEHLLTKGGRGRVDDLADWSGIGRRQLERRFLAAVGVSPKFAHRVARFREVVSLMHGPEPISLSCMAHVAGFADQPHMTREFNALAGVTPAAYRRSISPVHGVG
ncbi:MAG: AraC family transcriptional regulator [Gemmatimonadota bacterium]